MNNQIVKFLFSCVIVTLFSSATVGSDQSTFSVPLSENLGDLVINSLPGEGETISSVSFDTASISGLIEMLTLLQLDSTHSMLGAEQMFIEFKDTETSFLNGLRLYSDKFGIQKSDQSKIKFLANKLIVGSRDGSPFHDALGSPSEVESLASVEHAEIEIENSPIQRFNQESSIDRLETLASNYLQGQISEIRLAETVFGQFLLNQSESQVFLEEINGDLDLSIEFGEYFTNLSAAFGVKEGDHTLLQIAISLNSDYEYPFLRRVESKISVDGLDAEGNLLPDTEQSQRIAAMISAGLHQFTLGNEFISRLQETLKQFSEDGKAAHSNMSTNISDSIDPIMGLNYNNLSVIPVDLGMKVWKATYRNF